MTPEGWPTYSTGPRITPSEHFTMFASLREVEDRDLPTARMRAGFARMSECWPWMRMGKHEQSRPDAVRPHAFAQGASPGFGGR